MPEANVAKISDVCAAEGIIVDIRPTTPHAEAMLREGTALPKPEKVKAKTINETDVQIGLGKKEDLGKVGFFDPAKVEPHRPADFDSLPKETQDRIDKRIKQRKEEFADFKKDMQKLQDAGLIRIEPDGTVINTGLIPGGEKPFTGDHDIFDIRAKDGSKLTAEQYQKAKAALLAADAGVMHGGVTGWEVDSPSTFNTEAGQKSYNKMVSEHSPGGDQPLVRLGDGEPKAVWYEPAQPPGAGPRENTPGGRNMPADRGEAGGSRAGKEPNPADLEKIRQIAESDPDAFTVNETGSEVRPVGPARRLGRPSVAAAASESPADRVAVHPAAKAPCVPAAGRVPRCRARHRSTPASDRSTWTACARSTGSGRTRSSSTSPDRASRAARPPPLRTR